jgi:hypothetical protein
MESLISIDPGLSGGMSLFIDGKLVKSIKMPTKKVKIKNEVKILNKDKDGKKQYYKSGAHKGEAKYKIKTPAKYKTVLDIEEISYMMEEVNVIILEKQGCQLLNSTKACSSTMFNYGVLFALANINAYKVYEILPKKWKGYFGIDREKETAVALAEQKFDRSYRTNRGALQDGMAESALIGLWGVENVINR